MSLRNSILLVMIAMAFASGNSHAQDLNSYKKTYQKSLNKITTNHAQQVANITKTYATGLTTLKERAQAGGDLDKLKAILSEISRFEKDQTFRTAESKPIPDVAAFVKDCQAKVAETDKTKAKQIVALASKYDRALLSLQQEQTRKGELDKATAIQEERKILAETETLTAARALLAKASKARPSRPSPQPTPPRPKPLPRRIKGRFYVSVDDRATVYINGRSTHNAPLNDSISSECTLKPGDSVAVHLVNTRAGRRFAMAFLSTDAEYSVGFSQTNFRLLPDPKHKNMSPRAFEKLTEQPSREKIGGPLPFTFDSTSEWVWGMGNNTWIISIVTEDMIRRQEN